MGTLEPVALPFQVQSNLLGYDPTQQFEVVCFLKKPFIAMEADFELLIS
jgi:hypothetical protein